MDTNPYEAPSDAIEAQDAPRRVYRDSEDELLDNSTAVRIIGTIALVLGIGLGYATIYVPLHEALGHAQSIQLHRGAIGASLVASVCGIIMIIAGRHTRKILMHRWYNATILNVTCTLLLVAATLAATQFFEHILRAMGYTFQE